MISLRLMEDTLADYKALQSWFHEPELQEWIWCDEKGDLCLMMKICYE